MPFSDFFKERFIDHYIYASAIYYTLYLWIGIVSVGLHNLNDLDWQLSKVSQLILHNLEKRQLSQDAFLNQFS